MEEEKNNSKKKEDNEEENKDINIIINNNSNKNQTILIKKRNKLLSSAKPHFAKTSNDFRTEFPGFYNRKFNLDIYRKLRENIRFRLKSPKEQPIPNQKRGNGIPDDILERMKFLDKKFKDPKFIRYYKRKPEKKSYNFDGMINYIVKYSKSHSELDSIMMAFYYVCKEIKFDKECYDNNEETKLNQKPDNVYDEGYAVSSGFTNLFEYILRKMEIKFKHIDGYCKLMPKKKFVDKLKKNKKLNRIQSAKNFYETVNELNDTINHSWNAIFIKGEWYFCDCLFASGSIERKEDLITQINLKQLDINNNIYNYNSGTINVNIAKNNEKLDKFNFFYFMIPPELLITTHRPIDETWQFVPKILSFKEFYNQRLINYGDFYYNVYKYKVNLLTHLSPFISITIKEKLKIKIKIPKHVIEANLFNSLGKTKISEVKCIYDDANDIYTLEPVFPQKGEYILKINAKSLLSTDLIYCPLLDYLINVDTFFIVKQNASFMSQKNSKTIDARKFGQILPKLNKNLLSGKAFTPKIVTDYSKVFPPKNAKNICYDNENYKIIEPRNFILKIGVNSKFKIYVKGAASVFILDGNHMKFLKKNKDGIFEGQKEIETNNVSLCCLRMKNVFTELYKFKVLNSTRILSARPILKRKNKII